jgi:ATP synthase protein I
VEQSGQTPEDRDAALKARLVKLSSALKTEIRDVADESKAETTSQSNAKLGSAMGTGLRVGSELIAGVLVGGFLGWWIDRWLGTSPAFLLILLVLGMISGFWNVYRIAARPTGASLEKNEKGSPPAN